MNKQELADLINSKVCFYREYRLKYAKTVLQNKNPSYKLHPFVIPTKVGIQT